MQFGMLWDFRLNKQGRRTMINARSQPIYDCGPDMLFNNLRILVMRRQRMPVGDKKHAFKFVLQAHTIFQNTMVMTQMQSASWAHAG